MSTKTKANAKTQIDDPLMDRSEAAQYLGVTERWIKDRLAEGNIPFTKLKRLVRFRKSDLDAYIASHTTIPGGE